MTKRAEWAVAWLFAAFLGVFFLLNLALPDREFSQQENRYLQKLPSFSFHSLFDGSFTRSFETYCSDQFAARDRWISLKARLELLQGKKENNGIFLCAGERLLEPFSPPGTAELDRRIQAVNKLAENTQARVTLGLIPTAAALYGDLLPEGVPADEQSRVIDYIYSRVSCRTADILSPLLAHKNEYVFYRTDHHWTSLGAYYGYQALAGGPVPSADAYPRQTVSDAFCGTAYSSSGFFWIAPDDMEIFVPEPAGVTVERSENTGTVESTLYRTEMLETKDKYRFFLGGNSPRVVIRTGKTDAPSLLLIRDSYADSLAPFLLDDYSAIHLLDLRYFRESVADYIRDNRIDEVLVLYSVGNFCTDTNLALMGR